MPSSTSQKQHKQSRAVSVIWLIIGLLVALLVPLALVARNKVSQHHLEEYSDLWPYVLAQAKHESANFTSNVYRANHNPWGMKTPHLRPFLGERGTQAPDGGYYASYSNDAQAERDLVQWFRYVNFPTTVASVEDYAQRLKDKSYYGDPVSVYVNGMKRFL